MHDVLALSALHLSQQSENGNQAKWLDMAIRHKNTALAMFSDQLNRIEPYEAKAMVSFASRAVAFSLAMFVLAHYCVFLYLARGNWCIGSWGRIVVEEISQELHPDWQCHIEWARGQILG